MKIEITLSYKQSEFDKTVEEYDNSFYGGGKGGGKSGGLRRVMIKRRMMYPGTTGVIFRRTYPELYENHISKILIEFPQLEPYYVRQFKEIQFPNGSVLKFRYCAKEVDLENQRGQEYDDLGIEEAGQWPEKWLLTIKQANRTSKSGYKAKFICTGNPGGIGHKALKRLFITQDHSEEEAAESWAYVQALVDDNPWLMKDGGKYKRTLQMEKNPQLRSAYLEANWDIAAGQFFDTFRREIHVCKPFNIPTHWRKFGAYDHGFNHPAAFYWFATDEDGVVYVYREYVQAGRNVEQICSDLLEHKDTVRLQEIAAGHDCWAERGNGPNIAENFYTYSNGQIILQKAAISRVTGATQIRNYLHHEENKPPRVQIFDTCKVLIEVLPQLTHDPNNAEDVLKVDAVDGDVFSGDDSYDAFRYGMMTRPQAAKPVPEQLDAYQAKLRRRRGRTLKWQSM